MLCNTKRPADAQANSDSSIHSYTHMTTSGEMGQWLGGLFIWGEGKLAEQEEDRAGSACHMEVQYF